MSSNFIHIPSRPALVQPGSGIVKFLLHGDGPEGSTNIVDSKGNTIVNSGYTLKETNPLIDSSSIYTAGARNSRLIVNHPAPGTQDFTLEMYFSLNQVPSAVVFFDTRPVGTNGKNISVYYENGTLRLYSGQFGNAIEKALALQANRRYHIALSVQSGYARLFLDGTLLGERQLPSTYTFENDIFGFGCNTFNFSSAQMNGYLDEIRYVLGEAVYIADFVPGYSRFPD